MGDDKKKKLPVDLRADFLGSYVLKTNRMKNDKWQRVWANEESREIITDFLDDPGIEILVIASNQAGMLTCTYSFPAQPRGKMVYFVKKRHGVHLTPENVRDELMFGDVSPKPLDDLAVFVDEVICPILRNPANQEGWPSVVISDVDDMIQSLRNDIAEVRGNIVRSTLLPMPISIDELMEKAPLIARGETNLITLPLKGSLEAIVIKWSMTIREVLEEREDSIFIENKHPTPNNNYDFWIARCTNLENIYEQLRDVRVKTIASVLKLIDSIYYSAYRLAFNSVVSALAEARDNTLYLLPMNQLCSSFESLDFSDSMPILRQIMHTLCLIWANSHYYNTNSKLAHLFDLINNMIIASVSRELDPGSIFQGDADESLVKITKSIDNMKVYKQMYEEYRTTHKNFVKDQDESFAHDWQFKERIVFERFNLFFNRLKEIEQICITGTEFNKLDKVEIGGIQGKSCSRIINTIFEEFNGIYRHWGNIIFDPLDPDPKLDDFKKENEKFNEQSEVMERRLAYQFELAFLACDSIWQIIKLIQILTSLLHRPVIKEQLESYYKSVLTIFNEELDNIKLAYDNGMSNIRATKELKDIPVDWPLPEFSGAVMWIRKLNHRMVLPFFEFDYLEYPVLDNEEGQTMVGKYHEMLQLLDEFEQRIFAAWEAGIEELINEKLENTILTKEGELLKENFAPELTMTLKDVKVLLAMEYTNLPQSTLDFFERADEFWAATEKLGRIVEWYNYIHTKTHESEYELLRDEIEQFDQELVPALTSVNWIDFEQEYIESLYDHIKHICDRLKKTQANIDLIVESLTKWGTVPLFVRKDNNIQNLLDIEDRQTIVAKRLTACQETQALIVHKMDENFRLFFNIPLPTDEDEEEEEDEGNREIEDEEEEEEMLQMEFQPVERTDEQQLLFDAYEVYVDGIIGKHLMDAVMTSILYILNEIDNRLEHNTPLFEVKLELQEPYLIFIPSLDLSHPAGFITMLEELIMCIYSMVDMIYRIHQPPETERTEKDGSIYRATYETYLRNHSMIEKKRTEILTIARRGVNATQAYVKDINVYDFLWVKDRKRYLGEFLKYGRALTVEEQEEGTLPKPEKPALAAFSKMIDYYLGLRSQIEAFENYKIFHIFLRVDMRGFKYSCLNLISRWANLFLNYLRNQVTNSLNNLEEFCKHALKVLGKEITMDDIKGLLEVLGVLNEVDERLLETDMMFEPLKEIMTMLLEYGVTFSEQIHDLFAELPEIWANTKRKAMEVRQSIGPIQSYQVNLIEKRISLFEMRARIFRGKFVESKFFEYPCPEVYKLFDKTHNEITTLLDYMAKLCESAEVFEIKKPNGILIERCLEQLVALKQLWDFVNVIDSTIEGWKTTPWKKIDVEQMDQECKKFGKELRSLDKDLRNLRPYIHIDDSLKNLMTSLRAVTELQNPAIRERHWIELMQATKVKFKMDDSTTLADLLALNLHNYEEDVKEIVDKSVKEMGMEKVLKDLAIIWGAMKFEYTAHDRTGLKLLQASEELTETLEDHQSQLQGMLSSKFVGYFLKEVSYWQQLLSYADQVISNWFEVQRKWQYLESIFVASEDIRSQLPEDSRRFDGIDRDFKQLLSQLSAEPLVIKATNKPGLVEKLEELFKQLVLCEKALNDYLDTKRLIYPRFYFVSSADLLDILSNGNNPMAVSKHLAKLYDNLAQIILQGNTKWAYMMISKDNDEPVKFHELCDCSGKVEVWLNRVTDSMKSTLRWLFRDAVIAYEEKPRDVWLFDWPAQPALCANQIWWNAETIIAFAKIEEGYENAMRDYQRKQIAQLGALIVLLLGDLTVGDRQKIMTICTIDVHCRDVVAQLIARRIETSSAFQWQSQLRHRWDKLEVDCFANICDAQFRYDYEYLGNTPRLVITPLTDRCYITLTQSLHLIMGGAPAGPAGTGKTETTKDLGRALGIMVYVFNCSEQMDYRSCGNIHKGLAQTGAWGCFDEFNRISVEVLSVVAVQVKSIHDGIKAKRPIFNFMGEMIRLIPTVGMFITMNPGYAGRAELPENLKALYRPCAMVVPDFALISEIMLVAEGFQEARLLSRKFITLYTLCKELLSKQDHYDWGLRAIKSVLVVAGSLKRGDPHRPEDQVLMRALRDFNTPKIVTDDVPVFMGLIGDLFPALDIPRKRDPDFEAMVKKSALDRKLQPEDGFILKVVQLEELLAVRHSVFVDGYAGTGKTEVWKTLNKTYANQKRKPYFNDLSPKAVTCDELFGIINPATREWKDGLFSVIMRDQVNLGASYGPKWIVMDGDIDPMWIESLNTLMDDNKVLTLASNERIALRKDMRLLFEIANLRTATPATVSRAGILYINPQDLGWNPFVASWLDTRENMSERSTLGVLFDKYIPPLLEIMKARLKKITPITEIAQIQMTCHLLDCLLTPHNIQSDSPKEWYEIYFTFAVIWGFGSALFQDQIVDWRNEFTKWWHNEFKTIKYPQAGIVFNYYIDNETKEFLPWTKLVLPYELDPDIPLQQTLVNTAETTRLRYFMDTLIESNHPVMLVGNAGSGKSVIVADKMGALPEGYAVTNVPFNFYTSSEMLQNILEKPLERKAGRVYGPPGNKTMLYFIDDMNMPEVDTYGTVQPHTLIRQFMDYQHWYDRIRLSLKDIHNCQFVACMNPTAGSFTIDPRLQRHFSTFACNFPGPEALYHIYYNILSQHVENPFNKFPPSVFEVVSPLMHTAIGLHSRMNSTFLPTATKFHYLFNLRDMANIFSGMLFANGDCAPNPEMFIRLWAHEATRVYGDKLTDFDDLRTFGGLLLEAIKKGIEGINDEVVLKQPLIFCHFAESLVDLKYLNVKGWAALNRLLVEAQDNFNEMIGGLNLVLFEDAMSHICRINRILENARGYALLIGVGGSGKQSLTRLSAFISTLDVFQITLRRGYGVGDLKDDLANLYIKVGSKNVASCFLMTDSQVPEEKFLVLINDMLASGEIPNLFPDDQVDTIIGNIKNEVKQAGLVDDDETCWKFFITKVRRMLKVVLCFSPVGSTLRVRSRKFPAIVNCTSIDWFHKWPEEALRSVSFRFLSEIEILPTNLTGPVSKFMAFVHQTVDQMSISYLVNERRYNYTTPKTFLELIALYTKLMMSKYQQLKDRIVSLENGLLKLADCSKQVDGLQDVLKDQEVVLKAKNDAADKLIVIVGAENEKVQTERDFAADEEAKVRVIEEEVTERAKICDIDLKKAEPALLAAQAALNTLNKGNLTELKSFGSPPEDVVKVAAAVLVLMSNPKKIPKDRTWKNSRVMMGKVDQFLFDLINYDKEHIHPDIIKAIMPYIKDPEFDPDKILIKSAAAAGLCAWVINIYRFYEVFLVVEPKQRALNQAQAELKGAQDKLENLNNQLAELQKKLDVLQAEFDAALAEKMKCQAEADKTAFTIDLAHRLINGLASENVRWRESIKDLNHGITTLPGDILLISCFISYVGCFTRIYRQDLLNKNWMPQFRILDPKIPVSNTSDPLELITDDAQIAQWNNEGLPSDRMSAENATILTNSARWPLMIDPQLQGLKWIKQKYGDSLVVIRLTMRNYMFKLEQAVSSGSVMLIENIDESVDAVLDPLLGRMLIKRGTILKLGDKEIDYNPKFKLIIQTKLANPHYKPEMQAQTTLINFTVTRDGLEDQLLAEVVRAERPDLEQLKKNLTLQQNTFKITLKFLEDDLLARLSSAGENVLEDATLVLNLEKTKQTAADVEIKVREAKITSEKIDEAREQYRAAAERASILYFVLNELWQINLIYQFSLKAFTVVFNRAIEQTPAAETVPLRVTNLVNTINFYVFQYTTRALFERDKLIFMSQMVIQIQMQAQLIEPTELDFLLRYPYEPNVQSPFEFITSVSYGGIKALSKMDNFANLDKDIEGSIKRWKTFIDSDSPERERLPGEWKGKTAVQRLCILRALRPDRMTYAMLTYVEEMMGTHYVEARTLDFPTTFLESSATTHVFFILTPGVDPLVDVEKMGKKLGFSMDNNNFYNVSLGQGQEVVAENAIQVASQHGHWVILQNIHLVAKWLPTLEKMIEETLEGSHEDYRLFVSAEPAPAAAYHIIPQGILESAIKITTEPPTGMLANLHKALDNFSQATLEMCSKETEFKAILFALCYFHAVIQERRKFGPQGWNRGYPFNLGDLTISIYVLYNYLEANARVPWEDLRYLFGEIMYGGHITDDWDRRLCRTYLEEYMQAELIDGELTFCPGFMSPPNTDYIGYHRYIDENLPTESPNLYGLHQNAEIGFLTTLAEKMFATIFELQPRDAGGGGESGMSLEETIKELLEDFMDRIPEPFNMIELMSRVEERTPFIIVAFQECDRMNTLMFELKRSLTELNLGLKGELTITTDMEALMQALFYDFVPNSWTVLAYPSLLGLQGWFADLMMRLAELEAWAADFNLPSSVWLAGFFNPQSFLTAIMQQTARKNEWPLDRMCLSCDVTKKQKSEISSAPREGANINGLFMEGARWDTRLGTIADSLHKELFPAMPVVFIRAVTQDKQETKNIYECPVYKIRMRGPTFVWTFNLKTRERAGKWVLAGVCLLLQT